MVTTSIIYYIMILLCNAANSSLLKSHKNTYEGTPSKISLMVSNIINQHHNDKNGISIIDNASSGRYEISFVLHNIQEFQENCVYLYNEFNLKIPKTAVIIIFLNSNEYLKLKKNDFGSRSILFLIFIDEPNEIILEKTLKLLWERNYINVLIPNIDGFILTYNGFTETFSKIKEKEYSRKVLEDKTRNLNKAPINALFTFNDHTKIYKVVDYEDTNQKYEGKDFEIVRTVFENLNAKFEIINIDDTISDANENPWFSSLDSENKSEIQMDILRKWNITMLVKSERNLEDNDVIEATYPHTENAITILVPKHQKISKLMEAYNYLKQPLWLIHVCIPTAMAALLLFIRKFWGFSTDLTVYQFFRIMFACSTQNLIGRSFEKLLMLAWIIWCFLISIMAQAKITSMLSTDLYEYEIDSLEDIYRKENIDFIIFGLNSYVEELAEKYEGSKYMKVINDMVKVPMDENLGEMMLLEMPKPKTFRMSIVLEYDIAKFYARHLQNRQDGDGRPYLHLMKHSLMPCFQVFHVTRGSPLLPIINRKIRQLVEGGFIDLYKRRFLFKGLIDGYLYPDEDYDIENYEPTAIDMNLARHIFMLLIVGLLISLICFLLEVCIFFGPLLKKCLLKS